MGCSRACFHSALCFASADAFLTDAPTQVSKLARVSESLALVLVDDYRTSAGGSSNAIASIISHTVQVVEATDKLIKVSTSKS